MGLRPQSLQPPEQPSAPLSALSQELQCCWVTMASGGLQMLGFVLAFIGWIGIVVSTAMPQWKISSYAGDNIVTAQAIYEGLWMSCVVQSTGQMQCKVFDSLLKLSGKQPGSSACLRWAGRVRRQGWGPPKLWSLWTHRVLLISWSVCGVQALGALEKTPRDALTVHLMKHEGCRNLNPLPGIATVVMEIELRVASAVLQLGTRSAFCSPVPSVVLGKWSSEAKTLNTNSKPWTLCKHSSASPRGRQVDRWAASWRFPCWFLAGNLQATRALMVASILLGLIGSFVAVIGMKCMKCMEDDEVRKMRMAVFGGIIFLISGFTALVATSWYGHVVTQDFFDPFVPVNAKYEFGQALFVGWAAASLALLGGAFLCCSCPRRETSYPSTRPYPKSAPAAGKDYV
ncbi:hypothetical protein lerEdw1_005067 [Lerista edwardsae]|nr:hypothetical protein lerEdw1_005067 [Lerista edwardsae]